MNLYDKVFLLATSIQEVYQNMMMEEKQNHKISECSIQKLFLLFSIENEIYQQIPFSSLQKYMHLLEKTFPNVKHIWCFSLMEKSFVLA